MPRCRGPVQRSSAFTWPGAKQKQPQKGCGAAGVESIVTRTLPRREYWNGMLLQSED